MLRLSGGSSERVWALKIFKWAERVSSIQKLDLYTYSWDQEEVRASERVWAPKFSSKPSEFRARFRSVSALLHPTYTFKEKPSFKNFCSNSLLQVSHFFQHTSNKTFWYWEKNEMLTLFFSWEQLAVEYQQASPSLYSSCKLMQKMQVAA